MIPVSAPGPCFLLPADAAAAFADRIASALELGSDPAFNGCAMRHRPHLRDGGAGGDSPAASMSTSAPFTNS